MGACAGCGDKSNSINVINDFWGNLKIRNITIEDWNLIVKSNIDTKNTKKINLNKWENIMKRNLVYSENREISSELFRKAMQLASDKGGDYFLILSIVFLCCKDVKVKKEFCDLAINSLYLKLEFKPETNNKYMKKEKLKGIVSFYVSLISSISVSVLSTFNDNKKEMEENYGKIFSEDVQKSFVDEEMFKRHPDEWVNLDSFFENEYPILIKDMIVRERLTAIYDRNTSALTIDKHI